MSRSYHLDGLEVTYPGCDLSPDELEFLAAIEAYKARYNRRFPTWTEVLGVLRSLGYRKPTPTPDPRHPCTSGTA